MPKNKYEVLIDKDKYQVFLFYSHANMPFSFARHHWFLVNQKGELTRWEILFKPHLSKYAWEYLHKNHFPYFDGINIVVGWDKLWKGHLINYIEGDEKSLAKKMGDYIKNSPHNYPDCSCYKLLGPNSNTYPQWILNQFPEFKVKLSWNSIGKNYKAN